MVENHNVHSYLFHQCIFISTYFYLYVGLQLKVSRFFFKNDDENCSRWSFLFACTRVAMRLHLPGSRLMRMQYNLLEVQYTLYRGTIEVQYNMNMKKYLCNFNEHVTWRKINAWKNEKGAVMPWLLEGRPQNCQLAGFGR